jgi:hypothetical protein
LSGVPYENERFDKLTFLTGSTDPEMLKQFVNGATNKQEEDLKKSLVKQFIKYQLCSKECEVYIKKVMKFPGSNLFIFDDNFL